MSTMAPLSRTPMDAKSGRSMQKYHKTVDKAIASLTPWSATTRLGGLRARYAHQMPEDQQILVIPDEHLPASDPLFKDAAIANEKKSKRRG